MRPYDPMESGKRRTIYFVWNYVEWGGAQVYLLAIMKAAVADWDVVAVIPRSSDPAIIGFLEKIGARVDLIEGAVDPSDAPTVIHKIRRQWRRVSAELATLAHLRQYDLSHNILHIETAPWQSWFMLTALAVRRSNVFVTLHNFLPDGFYWRKPLWRLRMWFVSRLPGFHIFPANLDTKNKMRGWVSERFWNAMPVTHTAVNPEEINSAIETTFDRSQMRRAHGIDPDKFLVICVGQFIDRKGRWVFLDAAKLIADIDEDIAFAWVAPTPPNDVDAKRIADHKLGAAFSFVRSSEIGADRIDILKFFRIADAFALPSYVEGLPIALMEAMSMGLPSISTNVNSIPEAVIDHDTGILIEPGDPTALAAAILELRSNVELRKTLAEKGRTHILERFDERKVAAIVIDSYRAALDIR